MAPGGTCVLLASYVVTQADVDAGQVVNVGTGDSDETPPTTDPHTDVVPQVPSLSVAKALTSNDDEDGSFSVTLNDTLNYTVTATNTGNVTLSNVVVSDSLTATSTACATVAPGGTCVLLASYVVTQADVDAGQVVNVGTGDSDETPPTTDPHTEVVPQVPSLSVVKALTSNDDEDGSFSVTLNDTLNYTVTVTNTGNVTLSNVVASDDLTATSTACATVAPGGTCVLLASYVVTQADVDAGQVVNVGTGDSDETPPTTDPHTEVVPQVPSLSVAKALTSNDDEDGSFSVTLNDTLNYSVTVTNTGNVTLSNVVASDDLTATSTACATVAPGGTCVLLASYVVTQADVDAGQVVNVGTGDSDETPPTTDPHTEVVPQVPSLSVAKALTSNDDEDGSFSVTLNDTLNYSVTVTNTGNVTLSNVVASDDLTATSTACATVAPGGTCVLLASYVVTQADVERGRWSTWARATVMRHRRRPTRTRKWCRRCRR